MTNDATIYRSKSDGSLWRLTSENYEWNHAAGEYLTHSELVECDEDGFTYPGSSRLRLTTRDEYEWNDLQLTRRNH